MISLKEILRLAFDSVRAYGFRSALTVSGIAIGVTSVIAVVSIMQGLSYSIDRSFDGLGSNSVTIHSYTPLKDQLQGKTNRLTLADYRELFEHLNDIDDITPSFLPFGPFGTTLRHGRQAAFSRVQAVTANYQQAFKMYPSLGRFIGASDEKSRRKICVIGDKVREELELGDDPIGSFIEIGGEWFKVVGVMEKRGEAFGFSQDDYVLIPFSIGETMAPGDARQDIIVTVSVDDVRKMDAVERRATQILRRTGSMSASSTISRSRRQSSSKRRLAPSPTASPMCSAAWWGCPCWWAVSAS
jgi:putative ABC transport system permease protein